MKLITLLVVTSIMLRTVVGKSHSHLWPKTMRSIDHVTNPYLLCGAMCGFIFMFFMFAFQCTKIAVRKIRTQRPRRKIYRCRFCAGHRRPWPHKRRPKKRTRLRIWCLVASIFLHILRSCPEKTSPTNIFDTMYSIPAIYDSKYPR